MRHLRKAMVLQLGGVVLCAVLFAGLSRVLPLAEWIEDVQEHVMHWGVWSAICYPLLYACCNVLLLPGGVLSVGGGFFFGLWWGFLITLVGNVTGAAIAFLISRQLGKRWLEAKLRQNATLEALQPVVEREGWKIILLSQLHPFFPTSLLNYLYGLSGIRFRTCMLWVAIGQAPGLFLYAYLGTLGQLGLRLLRGKTHPHPAEYFLWLGGFAVSVALLFAIGRVALRLLKDAQAATTAPAPAFPSEPAAALVRYD